MFYIIDTLKSTNSFVNIFQTNKLANRLEISPKHLLYTGTKGVFTPQRQSENMINLGWAGFREEIGIQFLPEREETRDVADYKDRKCADYRKQNIVRQVGVF